MTEEAACGDDEGGSIRGMTIITSVIPTKNLLPSRPKIYCHPGPEPGSPKLFDSPSIAFSGDPRPKACGDDEGDSIRGMTEVIASADDYF